MTSTERTTVDVFSAAQWLDASWNSRARATGPALIEWECRTWGSGRGRAMWEETVLFKIVATRFDLATRSNDEERNELVVEVPLDQFSAIAEVMDGLGDEPGLWPWCDEDLEGDLPRRIALAAEVLELQPEELENDQGLLELLRIT
jgi:hypothetical protein